MLANSTASAASGANNLAIVSFDDAPVVCNSCDKAIANDNVSVSVPVGASKDTENDESASLISKVGRICE